MAQKKQDVKASYPLPVYNYRVTIDQTTLGFSEVSGLSLEYEPVSYKHGLSFWMGTKIIPGMRQPIKLTLKKGIVKGGEFIGTWLFSAYKDPFKSPTRDITISLCDELGQPVISWNVLGALPVKMDAPAFDANSNEIAIESLELIARDLQVTY